MMTESDPLRSQLKTSLHGVPSPKPDIAGIIRGVRTRRRRRLLGRGVGATLTVAAILVPLFLLSPLGDGKNPPSGQGDEPRAVPCAQVIPECHSERLPNRILRGDQQKGALHSVDGFDLHGVISFDAALRRAWDEDGAASAKAVQVVLGSANADRLHWGHGSRLYYGIWWTGAQVCSTGGRLPIASPHTPQCAPGDLATVIDAKTGAFVVGGTG